MNDLEFRRRVLQSFGASNAVAEELLRYTENVFDGQSADPEAVLEDEPFVESWRRYAHEAHEIGAYECLRSRLIQLQFPVVEGISGTEVYRAATKRGVPPPAGPGLQLLAPKLLRLEIHSTAAGQIPLVISGCRSDFVLLVQALTRRNEPVPIPESMGACMVAGYNNWDRVATYRNEWERNHPGELWKQEFARFSKQKELYQDRFILLSDGPYSGVSADAMGLPEDVWRAASLIIRREHECTHYYTRRVLGSMRNNLFDELIADYMGIVAVAGHFRADWFLRFMGLEAYPNYRPGARFENYMSGISEESASVLRRLAVAAANQLERGPADFGTGMSGPDRPTDVLTALTSSTLEHLAGAANGCTALRAGTIVESHL